MTFFLVAFALLISVPTLWIRWVFWRHGKQLDGMPGTGGELAAHLIKQYELDDVQLDTCPPRQDHYNPADNKVCLSESNYDGKSLVAIAVAAHEVGHAIQHNHNEPVAELRNRYLGKAHRLKQLGGLFLLILSSIAMFSKNPILVVLVFLVALFVMALSVLLHVAVLPEEWDASFNKALPILEKGNYVPSAYLPKIRQILKAAAFTYVAAALLDILRFWRWFRFVRF